MTNHVDADHVRYEADGPVAVVSLNRAEHLNAFTDRMEQQLIDAFDRSDSDDDVRVVVLTGAGRAFCAGMDLRASEDPADTFVEWRRSPDAPPGSIHRIDGDDLPMRRDGGGRVALRMWKSLKPIIAAINGHAIGVGMTMTLPADLRLASDTATFAVPFVRRAFVPESCSSWFLPRSVGMQTAMEWMLTGRRFDAEEALRTGLVRSVHPDVELMSAVMNLATEIASASPVSVTTTRRLLWEMQTATHPMRAHETETWALNKRGVSTDAREGIIAFLEKREPLFTDRVSMDFPGIESAFDSEPTYQPPMG